MKKKKVIAVKSIKSHLIFRKPVHHPSVISVDSVAPINSAIKLPLSSRNPVGRMPIISVDSVAPINSATKLPLSSRNPVGRMPIISVDSVAPINSEKILEFQSKLTDFLRTQNGLTLFARNLKIKALSRTAKQLELDFSTETKACQSIVNKELLKNHYTSIGYFVVEENNYEIIVEKGTDTVVIKTENINLHAENLEKNTLFSRKLSTFFHEDCQIEPLPYIQIGTNNPFSTNITANNKNTAQFIFSIFKAANIIQPDKHLVKNRTTGNFEFIITTADIDKLEAYIIRQVKIKATLAERLHALDEETEVAFDLSDHTSLQFKISRKNTENSASFVKIMDQYLNSRLPSPKAFSLTIDTFSVSLRCAEIQMLDSSIDELYSLQCLTEDAEYSEYYAPLHNKNIFFLLETGEIDRITKQIFIDKYSTELDNVYEKLKLSVSMLNREKFEMAYLLLKTGLSERITTAIEIGETLSAIFQKELKALLTHFSKIGIKAKEKPPSDTSRNTLSIYSDFPDRRIIDKSETSLTQSDIKAKFDFLWRKLSRLSVYNSLKENLLPIKTIFDEKIGEYAIEKEDRDYWGKRLTREALEYFATFVFQLSQKKADDTFLSKFRKKLININWEGCTIGLVQKLSILCQYLQGNDSLQESLHEVRIEYLMAYATEDNRRESIMVFNALKWLLRESWGIRTDETEPRHLEYGELHVYIANRRLIEYYNPSLIFSKVFECFENAIQIGKQDVETPDLTEFNLDKRELERRFCDQMTGKFNYEKLQIEIGFMVLNFLQENHYTGTHFQSNEPYSPRYA
jgi:hypothetical protein